MTIIEERPSAVPAPEPGPGRWAIDIDGVTAADLRPVKWQIYLAITGFALGALMGLLQAFERMGVDIYQEVGLASYYQGLTLHGVGMALILTFSFANGFLSLLTMRAYNRPLPSRALSSAANWTAWVGVALAGGAILANKASVLFTFYAPLEATPVFYVGAVLLVISTWLVFANMVWALALYRRENPGRRVPLLAYTSVVTYLMWFLASLGIAVEVLAFILPWSLGLKDQIDPQFTRTLFWFTGHPIVYFWLLPIYISWYQLLPKQVGAKSYSDGLVRLVFLAFLVLIPVGIHHQFTDPGIPFSSKTISWVLTFAIFFPSTVTAFSVFTSLEQGGRRRGGTGWIGWIFRLPWGNPAVAGQLLAGLAFMLGGASGFINASLTVNTVVHNTAFIPGHFHLTVGTGVALSIMAICYWLIPYLTGKELWGPRVALAQVWLWFVGVLIFSRGQMHGGLNGMPRRTLISDSVYLDDHSSWDIANLLTGIGGTIMFVSSAMFIVVVVATVFSTRLLSGRQEIPVSEFVHGPRKSWSFLDNLGRWAAVAIVASIIVYGEMILHYWPLNEVSEGFSTLW